MESSVRQAVAFIRSRYYEPITLNEVAAEVFVSPYHFSRIFSRAVGLTPGRYLTAVRLFAAKRMLLTTDLTVSDIVCSVGYNSVGTFTSRFTRAVGMSPTQYRSPAVARLTVAASDDFARMPDLGDMIEANRGRSRTEGPTNTLRGALEIPSQVCGANAVVGVFRDAAPQGAPVAFEAFTAHGRTEFEVAGVPNGSYRVIAVAMPHETEAESGRVLTANTRRHVTISSGLNTYVSLSARPAEETATPMAVTLADVSSVGADPRRAGDLCLQPTVA
ncbi:helix-turn-helix transcriptional regulator [Nocardiopsis sp. CNR-923]|uniref:helix-turn-helix transcriptional regulator n=1 Tax=Nocardiopsis sp. CNR-923 TaxID=1904965 RepID=UPI000B0E24F4|nr:AraC family transcriptional regulator [Nocardiopsis sp. CNR-923]